MDYIDYIAKHRGKIIGVLLGLLASILILKYGLLKTFFIALCVGVGYHIGKKIDERLNFKEMLAAFFRKD